MAGQKAWRSRSTRAPLSLGPTARQGSRRKVHPAKDTTTSDIRAVEFSHRSDGDSPILPELLDQIPDGEEIGTVTADGAYDTRRCHTAIIDRQAIAIIPIRKSGRAWKEDCPAAIARNETLRATRHSGRGILEAMNRIPRPQPDRSENAVPQSLRRTHRRKRPRLPDRRNPGTHRAHEPLLSPWNGRNRPHGLISKGKGAIMPQA